MSAGCGRRCNRSRLDGGPRPPADLLPRYIRLLLTEALRRQVHDLLGHGLGMDLLALGEKPEGPA
jgi:hypothetical protein